MVSPRSCGVSLILSFFFCLIEIVKLSKELEFAIFTVHLSSLLKILEI